MASLLTQLDQLEGLFDTDELTAWEAEFLSNVFEKIDADETFTLTSAQVEKITEIWSKHFA